MSSSTIIYSSSVVDVYLAFLKHIAERQVYCSAIFNLYVFEYPCVLSGIRLIFLLSSSTCSRFPPVRIGCYDVTVMISISVIVSGYPLGLFLLHE